MSMMPAYEWLYPLVISWNLSVCDWISPLAMVSICFHSYVSLPGCISHPKYRISPVKSPFPMVSHMWKVVYGHVKRTGSQAPSKGLSRSLFQLGGAFQQVGLGGWKHVNTFLNGLSWITFYSRIKKTDINHSPTGSRVWEKRPWTNVLRLSQCSFPFLLNSLAQGQSFKVRASPDTFTTSTWVELAAAAGVPGFPQASLMGLRILYQFRNLLMSEHHIDNGW